jgi:hypothetical protein
METLAPITKGLVSAISTQAPSSYEPFGAKQKTRKGLSIRSVVARALKCLVPGPSMDTQRYKLEEPC